MVSLDVILSNPSKPFAHSNFLQLFSGRELKGTLPSPPLHGCRTLPFIARMVIESTKHLLSLQSQVHVYNANPLAHSKVTIVHTNNAI